MLARPNIIPYALLHGGDRYMLFTLCPCPGVPLYGLLCSDIIHILDRTTLFMPLIVFCLLGAGATIMDAPSNLPLPLIELIHPPGRTRQATKRLEANRDTSSDDSPVAKLATIVSGLTLQACCF
jgi:hypothetical protein